NRVSLADVKDGRTPGPAIASALGLVRAIYVVGSHAISVFLAVPTIHGHERNHLDAMLPAPDLSAQRPPGVIGEHVRPWPDVGLRNAFGGKAVKDGSPIAAGLTAGRTGQGRLLHLLSGCAHGVPPRNEGERTRKEKRKRTPAVAGAQMVREA